MAAPTPESLSRSGSEFGEQTALFCWLNLAETRKLYPQLYRDPIDGVPGKCKLYATNNNVGSTGGDDKEARKKTNAIRGARARQSGVQSGVPDLFLPMQRDGCAGLYIELKINPRHPVNLKAKRTGKLSDAQKEFRDMVQAEGFGWAVAEGWEEARDILLAYLNSPG